MFYLNQKRFLAILSILFVISFTYSYWLLGHLSIPAHKHFFQRPEKLSNDYTNGMKNLNSGFHMRQHGQYWILYNYIKAQKEIKGNESVTLVLHGEWMDLRNFTKTMYGRSWLAPIALTLVTSGEDFKRARHYLTHIRYCSLERSYFQKYVSVNFIMHQQFLPNNIPRTEKNFYESYLNCTELQEKFDFTRNFRLEHNLKYPSNLARNTGRLIAKTDYVLTIDMNYIPSPKLPQMFCEMMETFDKIESKKTVFVVPSLDLPWDVSLPENQFEFQFMDQGVVDAYLNSNSRYKLPDLNEWLKVKENNTMTVFNIVKRFGPWLAYYISANDYEPFYNENYDRESKFDKSAQMDLLEHLDYDFYILNRAFLIRRILYPIDYNNEMPSENSTEAAQKNQEELMDYKELLMNFI